MQIPLEQLLAIIGGKEVELFLLKQEIEDLRKRLSEAEQKLGQSVQ